MNCKPGDLAVIVRTCRGLERNRGMLLEVLEPLGYRSWKCRLLSHGVDEHGYAGRPGDLSSEPDSHLRPIRDQPGEDEMLRIAGYPQKESA
jgi:hypothetical protein